MELTKWRFYNGDLQGANEVFFADRGWQAVNVPHTYNAIDGQCGNGNKGKDATDYYRGAAWYRTDFYLDRKEDGEFYLLFEGVNQKAEVYLNGSSIGTHIGGYTAFSFDVTNVVCQGENLLAVKVDNSFDADIAPLSADFTFYGGIYRPVRLIEKSPIHFPLVNGAKGVSVTTENVSAESAEVIIKLSVKNATESNCEATISASLNGEICTEKHIKLIANKAREEELRCAILSPRLWQGRRDPYLYTVDAKILVCGKTTDKESVSFGVRYFCVDKRKGFFLNGTPYPLRGVSRHQDRQGLGNALTNAEHDEDFFLIYEMGANAIRLAHYPQAQYFYDLCDKAGIVVWAEIPFVDGLTDSPEFYRNTERQLTELILQNLHHPSIMFWGLQNEVKAEFDKQMQVFMQTLHDTAKRLDPSRLTTQATNHGTNKSWKSDLNAYNTYPGWYGGSSKLLGRFCDFVPENRPLALSEYGAGGSHTQHEETPSHPLPTGKWHPVEYQTYCHKNYLQAINKRPYLWATFVWNMFDFASNWRTEGAVDGLNDKGMVSFDRKIKKDSYYLYQSNWSDKPMLHIAGKETPRKNKKTTVEVFSNLSEISLFVDGKFFSKKKAKQKGVFVFKRVPLADCTVISARADDLRDECVLLKAK